MRTTIARRACVLVPVFVLVFSLGVLAQSRVPVSYNPPTSARDLNSTLGELMRVAPLTNQDLTNLQRSGGRFHWVKFWQRDRAHKAQIAGALRRNLQSAVPSLIHDAQASGGSLSTTFKLYKDLSVVCESLDSILPPGSRDGNGEFKALNTDLSDLNRIREDISSYIQQTAASIESKNPQVVLSAGGFPKKIIIDDNIPDKPRKKRRSSSQ